VHLASHAWAVAPIIEQRAVRRVHASRPRRAGYSALGVEDFTAVEVRSHELMARHPEYYHRAHVPGFENAYLVLSAL